MSLHGALHNPVVLLYAAAACALLRGAGLLPALLRGLGKDVDHAWRAYRGWLLMVPLTALAIVLGREAAIVYFTLIGLLGVQEFSRATGLDGDRYLTAGVYLGVLAVGAVALVPGSF